MTGNISFGLTGKKQGMYKLREMWSMMKNNLLNSRV